MRIIHTILALFILTLASLPCAHANEHTHAATVEAALSLSATPCECQLCDDHPCVVEQDFNPTLVTPFVKENWGTLTALSFWLPPKNTLQAPPPSLLRASGILTSIQTLRLLI